MFYFQIMCKLLELCLTIQLNRYGFRSSSFFRKFGEHNDLILEKLSPYLPILFLSFCSQTKSASKKEIFCT